MLSTENSKKLTELMEQMKSRERRSEGTVEIISIFAYLIGVRKTIFENEHEPPQMEWYERLDEDKRARIIRNLCLLRTEIEYNYRRINYAMNREYKTILNLPEYIPRDNFLQLAADGINLARKSSTQPVHYIIEINRFIGDRINNCKDLFPTWLDWNYIKDLFIMPNGLTVEGTKKAAETYYAYRDRYPYQVYMNWIPEDEGNVLFNDRKFVRLLYEWHGDEFTQLDKVQEVGDYVKGNIYDFIRRGNKIMFLVDCENSDPYHLCATLDSLDDEYKAKVEKIILIDDVHTTPAWDILKDQTDIPVEHNIIERLKDNKSLVDITLTARLCQEHYQNQTDSFIIVSSDSDYWGVIRSIPTAHFLVMVEHGKCGPDMRAAMDDKGIFYCYIDEFFSGRSDAIKTTALFREMGRYIKDHLNFNLYDMLEAASVNCRANMSEAEKKQFFDKYIRPFTVTMDDNGNLILNFRK